MLEMETEERVDDELFGDLERQEDGDPFKDEDDDKEVMKFNEPPKEPEKEEATQIKEKIKYIRAG